MKYIIPLTIALLAGVVLGTHIPKTLAKQSISVDFDTVAPAYSTPSNTLTSPQQGAAGCGI